MAKRFTDSEKWKKGWFRKLPLDMKLLWVYICDNCNIAGIWDVDFELASFFIGKEIIEDIALSHMEKQISILINNKWLIKDFVGFQYGTLIANNNLHRSVLNILNNSGASQGLVSPKAGDKVKVKVKEDRIVKERNQFKRPTIEEIKAYCVQRKNTVDPEKWHAYYSSNGWKVGKNPMESWKHAVITWEKNIYPQVIPVINNAKSPAIPVINETLEKMKKWQKEKET